MEHLTFQILIDYIEENLSAAEQKMAQSHLSACSVCQHEFDLARRTLEGARGSDLVAPPPGLVRRSVAAFRRQQARPSPRPRQKAALHFDSWTKAAPLGLRGKPQERHLLYATDEGSFDIDLQIVKEGETGAYVLRGQVLGAESPSVGLEGIELRLTNTVGIERRGLADEFGRFTFVGLAEGNYSLHVILDDYDVVLETLVIES